MCYNRIVRVMNGVIGYIYRLHLFLRFVMENLKHRNKVIGVKQVKNALKSGRADMVYVADDADTSVTQSIFEMCRENGIEPIIVETRKELGRACGIDVFTAAAATLKS